MNMLSPKKLGISLKERNAVVKVRDGLANGEYRHALESTPTKSTKRSFNMDYWLDEEQRCGTVGCIGGWCSRELNGTNVDAASGSKWHELCYPSGDVAWHKITPGKAAKAIDNFLTGVEPWDFMRPKGEKRANYN